MVLLRHAGKLSGEKMSAGRGPPSTEDYTGEGRGAKGEQGEVEAVLDHRRRARSERGTGVIRGRSRLPLTRSRAAYDVIGRVGMQRGRG